MQFFAWFQTTFILLFYTVLIKFVYPLITRRVNQIFYKNSKFTEARLLYTEIFQICILYMFR